jgi:choline dehydrogenase-like flavoprotein
MNDVLDCSAAGFALHDLKCDVLIIGSGCGGGTAARVLAEGGKDVIVLEEGGDFVGPERLTQRDTPMYDQLYTDRGGRTSKDRTVNILSGRVLGGGGVINACDVVPIHEATWTYWQKHHGWSDFSPAAMQPYQDRALADLSANRILESQVNRNNRILREGAQKLGWKGELMMHNRVNCQGLGSCLIGCPASAKRNPRMVAIPKALAAGARVFVRARAVAIHGATAERKRVEVQTIDRKGYHPVDRFAIDAGIVIVAANPVGTVALLRNSGIGNGNLGQHVSLQPQVPIVALMPERVNAFDGIPQAYALTEFERHDPDVGLTGFRVESIFGTPGVLGSLVSQPGAAGKALTARLGHAAAALILIPDQPVGQINVRRDGRPEVDYTLAPEWKTRARQAVRAAARAYFAAGAQAVVVPAAPPLFLKSEADLPQIDGLTFNPGTISLISAHQQGGARLGPSEDTSVCDLNGQLWGTRGVFVMDGSVFPSTSSSHTMTPILTVAHALADRLLTRKGI